MWWGLAVLVLLDIFIFVMLLAARSSLSFDVALALVLTVGELPLIVPVWWFALRKYRVGIRELGFRRFTGSSLGIGCALLIGSYIFSVAYGLLISNLVDSPIQTDLEPVADEMSAPWLLILAVVFFAPVLEEVFFRGFMFAGLRERWGWKKAAIISSAVFALIHIEPLAIPSLFVLGFVFAYIYHRAGSIWPSIIMHFLVNSWAVLVQFVLAND